MLFAYLLPGNSGINLNVTLTIFSLIDGRFILPPTELNSNNQILKKPYYDFRC